MTLSAKGDADHHCLAARFVAGPHVPAPDKAEQLLTGWLIDLASEQAAAVSDLINRFPRAKDMLLGIAEASPYLFDLVRSDSARLIRLLQCEPEWYLTNLIEKTRCDILALSDEASVIRLLRCMKSEAALLIALCDIGGVWPVMQVTAMLTKLAVASVQAALCHVLRQEAACGRMLPPNRAWILLNTSLWNTACCAASTGGTRRPRCTYLPRSVPTFMARSMSLRLAPVASLNWPRMRV